MNGWIISVVLLAGCGVAHEQKAVLPLAATPPSAPVLVERPSPPPHEVSHVPAIVPGGDHLLHNPDEIVIEAQRAGVEADEYVISPGRRATVINRLGVLVVQMNAAVAAMIRTGESGRYRPTAVASARLAVEDLRDFLKTQR